MAKLTADYLLERLHENGVRRIYGYPGDGINAIVGALERQKETIEFVQNCGKGAALRAAFAAALKKGAAAVLTIDSDGQHDAAFAPAIVNALDRADIAPEFRAELKRLLKPSS